MTDRPNIQERYIRASEAHSLLLRENSSGAVDVLLAAGLSSQGDAVRSLALGLWRMRTGDMSKANEACDALTDWLERGSPARSALRGRQRAKNRAVVARTLGWWASPTCHHCEGRGHPVIAGTPIIDDTRNCVHCHGTGETPLERAVRTEDIQTARMLVVRIEGITGDIFHEMRKKLG